MLLLDLVWAALATLLILSFVKRLVGRPDKHLPPGPKGFPLIGNLLDVPPSSQWRTFAEWKERWGDVISVTVLGHRTIILNSFDAAVDLLEKKSAIYSDRPVQPMAGDLMHWSRQIVLSQYGDHFRNMRKLLYKYLGGRGQLEKIAPYHALIESETRRLLLRVIQDPTHLHKNVHRTPGAITLKIGYGYDVQGDDDPVVALVDRAVAGFDAAAIRGSFLVDIIPALRWVPSWFPGAAWKRRASVWAAQYDAMTDVPYDIAKEEANKDSTRENLVSSNLSQDMTAEQQYDLKQAASSLYAGGTDTTSSVLLTFFLAMTLFPEVQKKAQREIDAVIGNDRLPCIADRDELPYVNAVCTEILRWNPTLPLGIPHRSTEDNVYRGYLIPKGSVIMVNIWHLLRNPEIYPEPDEFKPERYLPEDGKEPEQDPKAIAFGFGRRVCPGLNLAQATVFSVCAMVLSAFDISKVVEMGREVTPEVAYGTGAVSHPLPFKYSLKPRSARAEQLIRTPHVA